jgi:GTPase SAR1 family protein
MALQISKRPALGQVASLGVLYDARTDSFVPLSILKSTPLPNVARRTDRHSTNIKFSKRDTYKEKFDSLGVNAELSASVLAGLVSVEGSGRFLTEKRDSNFVMQASMHYSVTTVDEELNIMSNEFKDCLASQVLDGSVATHVVTGINWGAQCVITAKREVTVEEDRKQIEGNLDTQFDMLKLIGTNGKETLETADEKQSVDHSFKVTVYGDVLANDGLVPTNFETAQKFIRNVHNYVKAANEGKGQPMSYTLLPLSILSILNVLEIKADITINQLSIECLEKYVQLFDELCGAQQNLHDYYARIRQHSHCIPPQHIQAVADQLSKARAAEATLKANYANLLRNVRSAKADAVELWRLQLRQLPEEFRAGESSPENILSMAKYNEKIDFVDHISSKGAQYIGYESSSLNNALSANPYDDAYVLFFNDHIRCHCDRWNENLNLLQELLQDGSEGKLVLVVDCSVFNQPLQKSYISQMRNARVIVEDVLEQRKTLANNCIMKYNEAHMDRKLIEKPLQRRVVKVPCTGRYCSRTLCCNWMCFRCNMAVEYGYVDDNMYCDCGGCPYDQWEFRCKDPRHGSSWMKHDKTRLLQLLQALDPFEQLNILILGKTGVGKSTWINAFINYLSFNSLNEALAAEDLKWVIPCSFSTQTVDKSDNEGRFIQHKIEIGSSDSEHKAAGESATQWATVYTVDIGETRVRLIDTPGIGDTRGVEQDNKNMVDILNVLRNYNDLHGIMILLRPDESRLDVMFKFCIKQLLTHLHRNAATNIAFGFTNARGSDYKPGDTFIPLQTLLSDHKSLQMGLLHHNVYCFDSESFRYLAARKQGIDMGLLEDNRRSWEYSVEESRRLINHFHSLTPHKVQSTLNLNETRHIIEQLSEPMARISQEITASIDVNEEELKELSSKRLQRDQLLEKLYVTKKSLETREVGEPRTVCTNSSCVEVRTHVDGKEEEALIYKTICHNPCGLGRSVKRNVKGHPGLQNCSAMVNGDFCRCGHHWMDHKHIYFDYKDVTVSVKDADVERDLSDSISNIDLQQKLIESRKVTIKEFNLEYQQVQDAAVQFGFFLKRHAITLYNDSALEYIDHQIDEEEKKIQAGGKTKKLVRLKESRQEIEAKIKALKKALDRGDNLHVLEDNAIKKLIGDLYEMKHYGPNLRDIMTKNEKFLQKTYRERSYNVHAGSHWTRRTVSSSTATNQEFFDQWLTAGLLSCRCLSKCVFIAEKAIDNA